MAVLSPKEGEDVEDSAKALLAHRGRSLEFLQGRYRGCMGGCREMHMDV